MYSLIALLLISALGLWRLPVLRTALHPLEVVTVCFLTAILQQFSYAILIINLQYLQFSGSITDFLTLKVDQLLVAPLILAYAAGAIFHEKAGPVRRALVWAAAILLLTAQSYYLFAMHILVNVHWTAGSILILIKNACLVTVVTGFAVLFRSWLRRAEVLA